MIIKRILHGAPILGAALLAMASGVSANTIADPSFITTTINYSTSGQFGGGTTSLSNTSGQAATLVFVGNTSSATGLPSNINLGDFLLTCANCTVGNSLSTTFGAFTFSLTVNDTTDNATGIFSGSSAGGTATANTSTIQIDWAPPQLLGPGTFNATTGNFGTTKFDRVVLTTLIVAPNSGTPPGDTTIQGQVSSVSATPEPGTFFLAGGLVLAGIGMARRRNLISK